MNQAPGNPPENHHEIFIVGDLRVDIGQQRVTRFGTDIPLPNLSFQLLVALIRGAPNVLSHDMLMARVWPGLIVSPETVNKRANLLREALGDDVKEPRYIGAVRSRGYRMVADVSRESSLQGPVASEPRSAPAKWAPRRWIAVSTVAVAVLGVGMLLLHLAKERQSRINTPIGTRAHTVAVLPFENISADASDAYLARGVPEMILNRLSGATGLAVIARNSSFALVTTNLDSQEIGRRLNSGYLISGSVQRKGDRLRVTVQLVDTASGTQTWSAHFDRALSDIFNVEDEIADQVTATLSAHVGGITPNPGSQIHSGNIEAYLAYLRGRALLSRFTVSESESAAPYFEKAIALDPNFAAAYASLYDARLQAADLRHEDLTPLRNRFRPLIDRALALDPDSGSAYFARAMWGDAPLEVRNADFLRGVALDPSNGRGLAAYAEFLDWQMGRPQEGARILQRTLQIDPMSPQAHFHAAMMSLEEEGAAVEEQNMLAVLELDPQFVPALEKVGSYRWMFHGKLTEGVQMLEHAIALDPGNPRLRHTAMAMYLDLGDETAARAVAAQTPQSARSTSLLSMFAGDWRAAGRAAYDDVRWDEACQNWLEAEALRDYALKTGELQRAITFINTNDYFEDDAAKHLDVCTYQAAVLLSQLLGAQGHASEAQRLRQAVLSDIHAKLAKYSGNLRRAYAGALLLDGRRDEAISALAEDFRSGDYRFWWYTLEHDPLWLPLHGDPRFQEIVKGVHWHVDVQRSELEELRRHGTVPEARRPRDSAHEPGAH